MTEIGHDVFSPQHPNCLTNFRVIDSDIYELEFA
jgi:hypothetical protein